MSNSPLKTFLIFLVMLTGGAASASTKVSNVKIAVNPYGIAPLTAVVTFHTVDPARVVLTIQPRGEGDPLVREFSDFRRRHRVPVLGLYPGHNNGVELSLFTADGTLYDRHRIEIATDEVVLPDVVIDIADKARMLPGMTLVSSYGHAKGESMRPMRAFVFDSAGAIRWYMDTRSHADLGELFYACGPELLRNGNLYFGDKESSAIYEVSMLGRIVNIWKLRQYGFHHDVTEKPDGNFLVTATLKSAPTVEDQVIEIDRNSGKVLRAWDLRASLQPTRVVPGQSEDDWFHGNAVVYDESDDTILVSSRFQGIARLSASNDVIWIMGPHTGWSMSGRGEDLTRRLLRPLDKQGEMIRSFKVLTGLGNHSEFEWNWYQHAPQIMPNGNIMLFDNGDYRNFSDESLYSRAVEYRVDDRDLTIQQVWSYGKSRGEALYSPIVSDIDYYPRKNRVIVSAGSLQGPAGKVIELDYDTKEVIFEATVVPEEAPYNVTFHRTERVRLF